MFRSTNLKKTATILIVIVLFSMVIFFGRKLLTVIIFSGLLAMLMTPVSNFLEMHRFPRVFTSLISVFIITVVLSIFIFVMAVEVVQISNDMPVIQEKLTGINDNLSSWLNDNFGVTLEQITGLLKDKSSKAMGKAGEMLAGIVAGTFTLLGSVLLALVFTFLFLLHREKYENFVVMFFEEEKQDEVREVVGKISRIAQKYLGGRIVSISILLVLYLIGFFAIGLKNSVLLASIAALLTFIPYVGPFVGGLFPILMAFITGSVNQALWITGVIVAAQLFQNYFIEPTVVGGSVSINPFFTILILIAGGMVWGVAGIILFLPMLGIFKIIFENVQSLRPFAYLIGGEEDSGPGKMLTTVKNWFFSKKS